MAVTERVLTPQELKEIEIMDHAHRARGTLELADPKLTAPKLTAPKLTAPKLTDPEAVLQAVEDAVERRQAEKRSPLKSKRLRARGGPAPRRHGPGAGVRSGRPVRAAWMTRAPTARSCWRSTCRRRAR